MTQREKARPLSVLAWPAFSPRARNPYTWLLYRHLQQRGVEVEELTVASAFRRRHDLLHVHWPERAFASSRWHRAAVLSGAILALLAICRLRGTRIVWTVHNLAAHDRRHPRLADLVWRCFLSSVDGLISLSRTGLDLLDECHPCLRALPRAVVPLGHFRDVYPDDIGRQPARAALALSCDGPVLLFFGQVRPYKNLPSLIRAFRQLADPAATLLIAGQPASEADRRQVCEAAAADQRVRLDLRLIPEQEVQLYFRSADLVVLPYADILHSGAAMLALCFDRPVLVPRLGAMDELAREVGDRWVAVYTGSLDGGLLARALDWVRAEPRPVRAPLDAFAWPAIAQATLEVYRTVLAAGRSPSLDSSNRWPGKSRSRT